MPHAGDLGRHGVVADVIAVERDGVAGLDVERLEER